MCPWLSAPLIISTSSHLAVVAVCLPPPLFPVDPLSLTLLWKAEWEGPQALCAVRSVLGKKMTQPTLADILLWVLCSIQLLL